MVVVEAGRGAEIRTLSSLPVSRQISQDPLPGREVWPPQPLPQEKSNWDCWLLSQSRSRWSSFNQ